MNGDPKLCEDEKEDIINDLTVKSTEVIGET